MDKALEQSSDIVLIYLGLANALQKAGYEEQECRIGVEAVKMMEIFVQKGLWNKEKLNVVEAYSNKHDLPALLKVYKNAIGEKENE